MRCWAYLWLARQSAGPWYCSSEAEEKRSSAPLVVGTVRTRSKLSILPFGGSYSCRHRYGDWPGVPPTIPCYHPKMDADHYRENIAATNRQIVDAKADIAKQRKIIEALTGAEARRRCLRR